jgi:hypothetical protein
MNEHHPEYAHPGKPHGLPLPTNMFDTMMLTPIEETRLGIPSQPPFLTIVTQNSEKENILASVSGRKHKSDAQTFVAAAASKRIHTL